MCEIAANEKRRFVHATWRIAFEPRVGWRGDGVIGRACAIVKIVVATAADLAWQARQHGHVNGLIRRALDAPCLHLRRGVDRDVPALGR